MINLFKHTTIDLLSKTRFIPHKKKTIKIFVYLILSYFFRKEKVLQNVRFVSVMVLSMKLLSSRM